MLKSQLPALLLSLEALVTPGFSILMIRYQKFKDFNGSV